MLRLRVLIYSFFLLLGVGATMLVLFFFIVVRDLPQVPEPLSRIIETPPTEIYAATGERIMLIGGREVVPLNRVSPVFIQAVLATEDHRFWDHRGFDKLRTLKALWVTLFSPARVEGASTVTQQLAKNLFFSFQRTYLRKFRELLVALQIESRYTKREILEAYINQIPFGVGAHGVEQAAQVFFGKPALQLSLPEAALLAGLPKSPTRYNPFRHFERAKARQKVVLARMTAVGNITAEEAERASQAPLSLRERGGGEPAGGYFLDLVLKELEDRFGSDVVHHAGLKVFTTLDPQLQAWAVESVQKGLDQLDQDARGARTGGRPVGRPGPGGAGGDRSALRGGEGLGRRPGLCRIRIQPRGASLAPARFRVQAVRLLCGFREARAEPGLGVGRPQGLDPDRRAGALDPAQFQRRVRGAHGLKRGLAHSVNSIAAQLVERTGPAAIIDVARRCGIRSPLSPVPSLALGTSGVSPLEMAAAFATFAAGGITHEPFFIRRVEDFQGGFWRSV
jgi:membrane peptidoglycan carboxypeptidase